MTSAGSQLQSRSGGVRALLACAVAAATLLAGCATQDTSIDADSASQQAAAAAVAPANDDGQTTRSTGYVSVDGIEVYYEVHGTGRDNQVPLVLLHGGFMTIDMAFGAMLPRLSRDRQIIAIEQQGHGHTADRDGPLTYERMAKDTAAVLEHLKVQKADVFGYSMGGVTGLELAIHNPKLVRKLVVASAAFDADGYYPGVLEGIAGVTPETFTGSGLPEAYASVAPNPQNWSALVEKVKQLDLKFDGLTPKQVQSITAPTLVIVGDSDDISVAHAARMFALLGGGKPGDHAGLPEDQLAVLPGTTHVGVLAEHGDQVLSAATTFFKASK